MNFAWRPDIPAIPLDWERCDILASALYMSSFSLPWQGADNLTTVARAWSYSFANQSNTLFQELHDAINTVYFQ